MSNDIEELWVKATRTIVNAGQMPMPIGDTLIELIKNLITEEQAKFILIFKRPSLSIDQIREKSDLDNDALDKILNELMNNGIIVGVPSRSTGIMVYRLLGPVPGIFEYTFLRGETGEKQKRLAKIFAKLFEEGKNRTQQNYETVVKQSKLYPAITRVVPVEQEIEEIPVEKVLPHEEISKIIDKFDDIAVAHCYCRHHQDLIDDPCKVTNERLNCFLLGKSAQFAIQHNFGKSISKDEAIKILDKASDEGLVHKTFHIHLNPDLDEEAICNCCSCCCGPLSSHLKGASPLHTVTSYLAEVNEDTCVGCGTCIEICPMETIQLVDNIAKISEDKCIGCGVCAHNCPEKAIHLKRTGPRDVLVPPRRVSV